MGRATAFLFADEGAALVLADRDAAGLEATADSIQQAGGVVHTEVCDLEEALAPQALVDAAAGQLGGLDIVVNNAGIAPAAAIDSEDYELAWTRTLRVDLEVLALIVRRALPHLLESDAARVVNIASTEGLGATAGISPYTASKHGVIGLTRALAVELGARGVNVNCVCPGPIHTGLTQVIDDAAKQKFARRRVPLRRYGDPEEVAQATLSLVLPAASYINGAVLVVDGGMTAQNT
jgi:3-oxoacyl-[acyl-carrier protein] reductase